MICFSWGILFPVTRRIITRRSSSAIEFFDQKYHEDPAFAQRVDDAVVRILTAKYRTIRQFLPGSRNPAVGGIGKPRTIAGGDF